ACAVVHRDGSVARTRQSRGRGWWAKFSDVFTDDCVAFEGEARSIRTYELARIPGRLQTPRYVESLMRSSLYQSPPDIERAIETRKQRQKILDNDNPDAPELWAVIDEAALKRI